MKNNTITQNIFAGFVELNEIDKAMIWAKEKGLTIREMQEALRDFKTDIGVQENKIEITNVDFND